MKTIMNELLEPTVIFYDLHKKKEIDADNCFTEIDFKFNYIYVLNTRNRMHNDLPNESSSYDFTKHKKVKLEN